MAIMNRVFECRKRLVVVALLAAVVSVGAAGSSHASDHLDSPTAIANPQADIGDVYAWTSPNGQQLNLIMDIVGKSFSDKLQYVLHIDSGKQFGKTTATTAIICRFPAANPAECRVGDTDYARGDASNPEGLQGRHHRFRFFAGLRDDPFFNNVKGTRAAYQAAIAALKNGAVVDAAGCPNFDRATSEAIFYQWRHTDGGPPKNFLAGWTASSIVISIDLDVVNKGGKLLAVWGTTSTADKQLNRVGRPLTKNALLGLFAADDVGDQLKEEWNAATPATSVRFIAEIQKGLAIYDGFDGKCGNQLLANPEAAPTIRYRALATLLTDDRLWVNSASSVCTQLFAVELATVAGQSALRDDCGGRSPNYNAANVWRSLLVQGTTVGVDDGLDHDEREHSATVFPFLAAPDAKPVTSAADPIGYKD
jgi:Domain of unknown function (DUF4331)